MVKVIGNIVESGEGGGDPFGTVLLLFPTPRGGVAVWFEKYFGKKDMRQVAPMYLLQVCA